MREEEEDEEEQQKETEREGMTRMAKVDACA
jgi:hypothetical protein